MRTIKIKQVKMENSNCYYDNIFVNLSHYYFRIINSNKTTTIYESNKLCNLIIIVSRLTNNWKECEAFDNFLYNLHDTTVSVKERLIFFNKKLKIFQNKYRMVIASNKIPVSKDFKLQEE